MTYREAFIESFIKTAVGALKDATITGRPSLPQPSTIVNKQDISIPDHGFKSAIKPSKPGFPQRAAGTKPFNPKPSIPKIPKMK